MMIDLVRRLYLTYLMDAVLRSATRSARASSTNVWLSPTTRRRFNDKAILEGEASDTAQKMKERFRLDYMMLFEVES